MSAFLEFSVCIAEDDPYKHQILIPMSEQPSSEHCRRYWCKNITLVLILLTVWFLVSLGSGILFRDWLDLNFPKVGNAPFGFWMAQQGSIICFVILLLIYKVLMNRLEGEEGFTSNN